jgi:hypothetical protein
MNPLKKWTIFLALSATIFYSCKKDNSTSAGGNSGGACSNSFTFLANGKELVAIDVDIFGDTTYLTNSFTATADAGTFKNVIGDSVSGVNTIVGTRYMRGCNGWLTSDVNLNVADSLKLQKENCIIGDTWTYYDPQGMNYNTYVVDKKNVSVTVAAGTFTCDRLLYTQVGAFNTDTVWWSNTYNIVKYSGFLFSYQLYSKNY